MLNVSPQLSREHRNLVRAGFALLVVSLWLAFGNAAAAQTSSPLCFGVPATIIGTGGADNLTGTSGDDVIVGLGGSDKIDGRGGNDLICGGAGHDSITGGDGNDRIDGGSGDDTISGGGGNDRIFGGPGDDSLSGNAGDDQLFGEGGADSMNGGAGSDNCFIESGADNDSGCETDLPPNQAPTDILLSGATIPENEPAGTSVGTLSAVDPDAGDTHTFTVVAAAGTDFASFAISGNSLNSAAAFDFETKSSYTVTIEVSDGLATFQKTFTITVTDADDPPAAVGDSATVSEDSGANSIDVLANDTDVDGGPKTVASVTQPANGTVVNNGTDVDYTPNADYCNNPTGSGDTFTYTLNGGSSATVSVAVTCADDPPVAVDDSATVSEDSGSNVVNVLGNDTDVDGGPISVASVTQPANGTVVNNGTDAGYTPNADYCNSPPGTSPDTFTYTLNSGSTATVSVTVTCGDDPPAAVDDSATVSEDSGASVVSVRANDTDIDGGPLNVVSATDPANGTVVVSGGGLTYSPDADYCNSPPGTTPDTFSYTLNGGSTATVSVTVTCVDDPPVAVDDSATVSEDSGSSVVSVLANDTDIDGGPISVASVTQPANGTVVNNGTDAGYTPNANYCNSPPGTSPDTFTYTLNGGSTATVSVTVTCVDDPAGANDDSATVGEDSGATAVDVLANDGDPDGGAAPTISSATDPANGSVVLTGGSAGAHTGLTYQPDPNYCNSPPGTTPDTFIYTISGGATATVSVTVTCVDDPPVAVGDSPTVSEDSGANSVDVLANDTDIDGGPIGVASVTQPANGTVVNNGTDVGYTPNANYCNSPVGSGDTFTYTLNGGSSATVSVTVTCVDDPPTAVDDSATVGEDTAPSTIDVLANDTDADGGPIGVASVTQPANGAAAVTGGGTGVSYAPSAHYCNNPPGSSPDTFTYTLNGGSTATVSVTVTCAPDNPVVDTTTGALAYTEDDPPSVIDTGVTVTDFDAGAIITGATIEITDNFAAGQDVLALSGSHPGITAAPQAGNTLTLSGTASPSAYQAALQAVTYSNTSQGPSTSTRTVTFTVTDDTALSGSDTKAITVAGVNDPPTAVDDTGTTDEDTPLNVAAPGVLANDTDVDPGDTKTVVALNGSGTLTGSTAEGGNVTINANGSYTYTPPAAFQALSTGQSDTDSFQYTMADGAGAQSMATVNLTVNGVSDAPTAVADSFDAIGNTGLFVGTTKPATDAGRVITGSVLANDTDPDSPSASLVAEPVINAPTALGGTVTMESDGNFTYHPDDVDTGVTDTFSYRVCDASPCNSGTVANSTGTLSLVIGGQVWYVRNNQAAGGDGTSDAPFDTLVEAESASGTGDTVYVFDGDNTSTGLDTGYLMNVDERLIGQHSLLSVDPDGPANPLPLSLLFSGTVNAHPTLTTASAEDVVSLAAGAIVVGVNIDPGSGGGGIGGGPGAGGPAASSVQIANVNIIDTGTLGTQPGLELNGTTLSNSIYGLVVNNGGSATATGVRLVNAGNVFFDPATLISITTSGAKALDASGTSLTSQFDDITVTGSGTGGVAMTNITGTTTFTNLSLTTTSGTAAAFALNNAGAVTVSNSGTANISATGGPAIDVAGTSGAALAFDDVDSTASLTTGISLNGLGAGTFSANGSSVVSSATGTDFNLVGGTGGITYDGTITDNTGQLVNVQNTSGGLKDFNGSIGGIAGAAGGNIALSGNTGATIRFDGGVNLSSSGVTSALSATGGGTLAVTGTNKLGTTTSTGQALNVLNTTIHDDDLTFESVRSNTAANGVVLNNTINANGRLFVTGNGGTCSTAANCTGASIQNSTGAGIELTSVPGGVSLTRVAVTGGGDDGIRATTVHDVDLVDSVVLNNGNFHGGGAEERGLDYLNVTATPQILRTTVSGSDDSNAHIRNTTSTASTLTVDQSTFSGSKFNAGLRLRGEGSSVVTANVTGSVFSTNADPGFSMQTDSANTASQTLLFDNNDVSGGSSNAVSGRPQVSINVDSASIVKATVSNNDIKSAAGAEVILNTLANHTGTFDVKVIGNDIGDSQPGALDALADGGSSIWGWAHGDGITRMEIRNNTVANWGGRGMELSLNDGTGDADYTVTGNVLSTPDVSANTFEGIYIFSGGASGDASDVCVDMENNDMDGIGRQGVSDIALDRFTGNILRFADFNDTSVPNLQTNLRGKNPLSPSLSVETFSNGPTATTDTACDLTIGTP